MSLNNINVNNTTVTSVDDIPSVISKNILRSNGTQDSILSSSIENSKIMHNLRIIKGYYVDYTGNLHHDINYDTLYSGKIYVRTGEKYTIFCIPNHVQCFFYNNSNEFIERIDVKTNQCIEIPSGVRYIIIASWFETIDDANTNNGCIIKSDWFDFIDPMQISLNTYNLKQFNRYTPLFVKGKYIRLVGEDNTFYLHTDINYNSKILCVACCENEIYEFSTTSSNGIVWLNSDFDIVSFSAFGLNSYIAPKNSKYAIFSAWQPATNTDDIPFILKYIDSIEDDINWYGTAERTIKLTFYNGYIDYTTGEIGGYHDEGRYAFDYKYIPIIKNHIYKYTGSFHALAGIAFYDNNFNYISGYNTNYSDQILRIPENAIYMRLSDYNSNKEHNCIVSHHINGVIYDLIEQKRKTTINIVCVGDSVTEGMATQGAHYARYGEAPYPARLTTLLVDNGFTNTNVQNYGHGGEKLQDVAVRLGAWPVIITENINLPNNTEVSLGQYSSDDKGRISGTKLKLLHNDQYGDDYYVYLTQTSHDTNPITINGIQMQMSIHNNANYLIQNTGNDVLIPAGSVLFTANNRNADVIIIYIGINGVASINLETWLNVNKKCGEMNGGKYIIIGSTHTLFNSWPDCIGSNIEEKHQYYKRKCIDTFGLHFIDMYQDFFDRGVKILDDANMMSKYSSEQRQNIISDMSIRIVPKEFSYNGQNRGDVHLSLEGYHIFGQLLFERLKQLNYI